MTSSSLLMSDSEIEALLAADPNKSAQIAYRQMKALEKIAEVLSRVPMMRAPPEGYVFPDAPKTTPVRQVRADFFNRMG